MFRRSGIKVQAFVPLTGSDGEQFPIPLWTWWKDQISGAMERLTGAQGPWLIRSEHYISMTWTVIDEEQLEVLANLFERTRGKFGLHELYSDYCDVTFAIARPTRTESI